MSALVFQSCFQCGKRWPAVHLSSITKVFQGQPLTAVKLKSTWELSSNHKNSVTSSPIKMNTRSSNIIGMYTTDINNRTAPFLSPQQTGNLYNTRFITTEPTTFYERMLASDQIHYVQSMVESFHDFSGLSWGGTIIALGFTVRFLFTFPVALFTEFNQAKVASLQGEILNRAKYSFYHQFGRRMKNEKWSSKRIDKIFKAVLKIESRKMYAEKNCHPLKSVVLFFVQIPLFVAVSMALRNMTGAFSGRVYVDPGLVISSLSTESFLWIPTLSGVDPFFILPSMVGVLNLINLEMRLLREKDFTRKQKLITYFFRGFSICMIPIASYMPSAIPLYWASSALYSVGQNVVLRIPSVRRGFGIPRMETDSDTPFRDMKAQLQQKFTKKADESSGTEIKGAVNEKTDKKQKK